MTTNNETHPVGHTMIVFDDVHPATKDLAPFWMRFQRDELTVDIIELGAVSLPEAVKKAVTLGFNPTHWHRLSSKMTSEIPKSVIR